MKQLIFKIFIFGLQFLSINTEEYQKKLNQTASCLHDMMQKKYPHLTIPPIKIIPENGGSKELYEDNSQSIILYDTTIYKSTSANIERIILREIYHRNIPFISKTNFYQSIWIILFPYILFSKQCKILKSKPHIIADATFEFFAKFFGLMVVARYIKKKYIDEPSNFFVFNTYKASVAQTIISVTQHRNSNLYTYLKISMPIKDYPTSTNQKN